MRSRALRPRSLTSLGKLHSQIRSVVEGPPFKLLEAAAEHVARTVLQQDARVAGVQVYLRKPHVAVTGTLDSLGEC